MKYYIHSLQKHTYFAVDSFDKMIDYFVRQNTGRYQGVAYYEKKVELDPRKHHYQDYNTALSDIAMHPNDMAWSTYSWDKDRIVPSVYAQRDIMVKDELGRTIDPRHYWDIIATRQPILRKYRRSYRRSSHPWEYRRDPISGSGHKRRGRYYRRISTFQERKLACDPEVKEYIKPSRNIMNLPSSWDEVPRQRNHCWKAKKIDKQYMKHVR